MPTIHQLPPGLSHHQKMAAALYKLCKPCCPEGGSGGGVPMPNGCATCNCCPCICWWWTTWHKSLTKDSFLIGPFIGAYWTLVSNTLTQVGGDPDYMYLGETVDTPGSCALGGLGVIDNNGDIIFDLDDPGYPRWEGQLTYSDGISTLVYDVVIRLNFSVQFGCDGELADGVVWAGTSATLVSGSLTGIDDSMDYSIIPNDIIGSLATFVNCGGTITFPSPVNLPPLTITPMYDPNCTP